MKGLGWLLLALAVAISAGVNLDASEIRPSMGQAAVNQELATVKKTTTTIVNGRKVPSTTTTTVNNGAAAAVAQPCQAQAQPCVQPCQQPCGAAAPALGRPWKPTRAPRKLSSGDVKKSAKKVQKLANKMFAALKKNKRLLRNPRKFNTKAAAENVAKLSEEVRALLKAVKKNIGKKGGKKSNALARLEGAIKNLDWHMQKDLRSKQGSITLAEMSRWSRLLSKASAAAKQSRSAQQFMQKIERTAAGAENIIRGGANTLKIIRDAQKRTSRMTRRDQSANRADIKAAGASLQAAEGAASTVGVGKSKASAKRAAQIAAGAIESAKTLDSATRRSSRGAAAVGDVLAATAKAQAGEARALAKAAASTYKVLGKAQKANQKAALLRAKVKVDAGRAERMVMKIVNAQSKNGAKAAEAAVRAEISASKAKTLLMLRGGLKGVRSLTKNMRKTYTSMDKTLSTAATVLKVPEKQLKRTMKRLKKDTKSTSVSGVAKAVISAANAKNSIRDAKGKKAKLAADVRASSKASKASVKVVSKAKVAEELISSEAGKAALEFAADIKKHLKREQKVIKGSIKKAKAVDADAKALKVVTQRASANSLRYVQRKTNRVLRRSMRDLKKMYTGLAGGNKRLAVTLNARVQSAQSKASRLASKDKRSHQRIKNIAKVANSADRNIKKTNNRARNALASERVAAKAAKRDGQKSVAKIYKRSEKIAKKELKQTRTAAKDAAAAKAAISAEKNAVRFGEKPAENSLQAVVDAMRSAAISASASVKGLRTAQNADKNPQNVAEAGQIVKQLTGALRKGTGRSAVQQLVQRQKAKAVAAAEKAASTALGKRKGKSMKAVAHKVVLAAVRRENAVKNAAEIVNAVKAAGVALTPAAISAALNSAGMRFDKIAKALSNMGVSAAAICNSLSSIGSNANPAKIAKEMSRAGFSTGDIVSGLTEAGLASSRNMGSVMASAGLKISSKGIKQAIASQSGLNPGHKIITGADKLGTRTGLPKGAASTLSSMSRAGIPVTPLNVAKALKKIGMSTLHVMKTLTAVGVSPEVGAAAMKQSGFKAMAVDISMRKVRSSSAINTATLGLVKRISNAASDIIKSMVAKKITLTRDNLRNALKGEGVSAKKVERVADLVAPKRAFKKVMKSAGRRLKGG